MIRPYKNSDKIWIEMWMQKAFHTSFSKDTFTHILIYEEEIVKAFLHFSVMYERAEINYIYVENQYRNQKIATSLLLEMLKVLKKKNVKTVTLEVSIQNQSAIAVYEKIGFKKVSFRFRYYNGEDAILMLKDV